MGFIHDGTPQSSIRRLSSSVGPVSTSGATRSSSEIARVTGAYWSSLARQSRVIEKAHVTKMIGRQALSMGQFTEISAERFLLRKRLGLTPSVWV